MVDILGQFINKTCQNSLYREIVLMFRVKCVTL